MTSIKKKVLITGHTGMLGLALIKELFQEFQLFGVSLEKQRVQNIKGYQLNLTKTDKVFELIKKIKPNLIIHTAAMTSVDGCEERPEIAQKFNAQITSDLANIAKNIGAFFIYISTDFVFGGKKGNYIEKDQPNPRGVYAQTKLAGERVVEKILKNYLILRVTIYGWNLLNSNKKSLPEMVIDNLSKNKEFTAFNDQYFTPIYTGTLAKIIKKLYNRKARGIFNVACDERLSKYEFAKLVAEIWKLNQKLIKPISFLNANYKAPRPVDASLNNSKVKNALEIKRISAEEDLKEMKRDYKKLKGIIL